MSDIPKWCTHTLKTYDESPIGGYPYLQTTGIRREFGTVPIIEDQAKSVAAFRKGNGLPRDSVKEALEDISCYTCFRLGNSSRFCRKIDGTSTANTVALSSASPSVAPPCATCGIRIQ